MVSAGPCGLVGEGLDEPLLLVCTAIDTPQSGVSRPVQSKSLARGPALFFLFFCPLPPP